MCLQVSFPIKHLVAVLTFVGFGAGGGQWLLVGFGAGGGQWFLVGFGAGGGQWLPAGNGLSLLMQLLCHTRRVFNGTGKDSWY
jgi:hypothetical protein